MTESDEWVFKNKEHGKMAATASLGMVLLWDVDEGLNQLDKYFHHSDEFIKAGACLGIGVVSSGVRHESDPALALLSEHLESTYVFYNSVRISKPALFTRCDIPQELYRKERSNCWLGYCIRWFPA